MAISLSSRRAVLRRFASLGIARHIAFTRRPAIQRKDLLCTTQRTPQLGSGHLNDSQRDFAYCDAPQFNARICLLLFASRHGATLRGSVRRSAALRNSTICLLQRLSTRLGSSLGTTAPRRAPRLNSTQRFVCQFIAAPPRVSAHRNATRLLAAPRISTQRTET